MAIAQDYKIDPDTMGVNKVLIYRLGSLGDTVVALPALHMIARVFPDADRVFLGTSISNAKASHPSVILEGTGLVGGYIEYPSGLRDPRRLLALRKHIKAMRPDMLVYLAATRGRLNAYRDTLFFKLCGITNLVGVPTTKAMQENILCSETGKYEHEAERLTRCVSTLGDARPEDRSSWDLHLSAHEIERARDVLGRKDRGKVVSCSPGSKVDAKHWGKGNWQELMGHLFHLYRDATMLFIGAKSEREECKDVGRNWRGRKVNACGLLSPRESAAAISMTDLFIGHDSGPMHLAAAVGVPCVAIFSARNKPGVWFPYGDNHNVIYHKTDCFGCGLEICLGEQKKCVRSITVDEVLDAIHALLQ